MRHLCPYCHEYGRMDSLKCPFCHKNGVDKPIDKPENPLYTEQACRFCGKVAIVAKVVYYEARWKRQKEE